MVSQESAYDLASVCEEESVCHRSVCDQVARARLELESMVAGAARIVLMIDESGAGGV